ncbi:hypothetical protein OIU76_027282 [Salix suchowensis]|nr:hypothetical protein OIU76_027282 [Salix suchowensis]
MGGLMVHPLIVRTFNGMLIPKRDGGNFQGILSKSTESQVRRTDHDVRTSTAGSPRGGGLTRDFLGLKAFPHKDWLDHIKPSTNGQRNQNLPPPWQG